MTPLQRGCNWTSHRRRGPPRAKQAGRQGCGPHLVLSDSEPGGQRPPSNREGCHCQASLTMQLRFGKFGRCEARGGLALRRRGEHLALRFKLASRLPPSLGSAFLSEPCSRAGFPPHRAGWLLTAPGPRQASPASAEEREPLPVTPATAPGRALTGQTWVTRSSPYLSLWLGDSGSLPGHMRVT